MCYFRIDAVPFMSETWGPCSPTCIFFIPRPVPRGGLTSLRDGSISQEGVRKNQIVGQPTERRFSIDDPNGLTLQMNRAAAVKRKKLSLKDARQIYNDMKEASRSNRSHVVATTSVTDSEDNGKSNSGGPSLSEDTLFSAIQRSNLPDCEKHIFSLWFELVELQLLHPTGLIPQGSKNPTPSPI